MTNKNRIEAIATEAIKLADTNPDASMIRVGAPSVRAAVVSDIPSGQASDIVAAMREVFLHLAGYEGAKTKMNGGEHFFVDVFRPYNFPSQSKLAQDILAKKVGYAISKGLANLSDKDASRVVIELENDRDVAAAFCDHTPTEIKDTIRGFLTGSTT